MNIYFLIVLFIIIGQFFLETIIEYFNLKKFSTVLPKEFVGFYDESKYENSQRYLKEKTWFNILQSAFKTAVLVAFIIFGLFNYFDEFWRTFHFGPIVTGLFFCLSLAFIAFILSMPFSCYNTFIIEERYNFNKVKLVTFITDMMKSLILIVIFGSLAISGILWFFEKTGSMAWIYSWIGFTIFQVVILYIAPNFIMPLFNKFSSLEEGELKSAIENYAKKQNFVLRGIYVMDGSKRSTKSNAFFTGFGKFKRVVLFDTLIGKLNINELVVILAHEIGHFKKRHILKMFSIAVCNIGFMFFSLSLFINDVELFSAFKMQNLSFYASILFFCILYIPIQMVISLFINYLSRKHEYEADRYAVQTTNLKEEFISGLKKLSVDHLSNLNPHILKVLFEYSHPPILERIDAIKTDIEN